MSSVDDRIVNMQFNNKQFVGGAQESEKALTSLEASLAKTAQSKGLETLGNSVETVKTRFGAMQVAGVAAVATIASKATAAGLNLLKSLTIEPVMDGFREYQTNLESVQTIMSNTGKSVKVVNANLDILNEYADKTVYNFSQMAKNVGTFSAAGVDLKTSVASIQGISNLAALSGSSAQQASTAMYQLSQAIAAGRVNLQDWNSVVNAGMGGKQFQLALARTAEAMGKLEKGAAVLGDDGLKIAGKSFRESISAVGDGPQWLTSGVLIQTLASLDGRFSRTALAAQGLKGAEIDNAIAQARHNLEMKEGVKLTDEQFEAVKKMADAAYDAATQVKTLPQLVSVIRESIGSTFSSIFRTVLGDFEQSKELWGKVSDAIIGEHGFLTKAQDALTGAFESWADSSDEGFDGRTRTIEAFKKIFASLGEIFLRVKRAFNDVFPPSATNILKSITIGFEKLAGFLTIKPNIGVFKDLRAIFAGFFSVLHIGLTILGGVKAAFSSFFDTIFSSSGQGRSGIISMIADVARLITGFDKWLSSGLNLVKVMEGIGQVAGAFIAPFVTAVGLAIKAISVLTSGKEIEKFDKRIARAKESFSAFSENLHEGLEKIFGSLDKFDGLGDKLGKLFDFLPDMSGIGASIVDGITEGLSSEALGKLRDSITKIATGIVDWFKELLGIHSPADELKPVGQNIVYGIVEGLVETVRFLTASIASIVGAIITGFFDGLKSIDPLEFVSVMNAIFSGALILTVRKFVKGMTENSVSLRDTIKGTFNQLTETLKTMQNAIRVQTILNIAIAVGILAAAIIALSFVPMDDLAKGLGAVSIVIGLLVGAMAALSKIDAKTRIAVISTAFISMATSILILSGALAVLALIPVENLAKGVGAIAILLSVMSGLMIVLSKNVKAGPVAASSMIAMAFAINLLSAALVPLALIPVENLAKGVGAIIILLAALAGTMIILDKFMGFAPAAASGMIAMAFAINLLTASVIALGMMPFKVLEKGLKAVGLMLLGLTIAMAAMAGAGPMALAGAAGMIAIAVALNMLVPLLVILGNLGWDTIGKGLLVLTGLLVLMTAAVIAIGAAAMIVGPGLLIFGQAIALVGLGMLAFGTGFAIMAAAGVAGVAVLTAAFHAFMALLPTLAVQLAAAVVAFIQTIAAMTPKLRKAFGTIIESILGTIEDAIPHLASLFQAMIDAGIQILMDSVPQMIELGFTIIDSFLESVAEHVPNIVDNAVDIITTFTEELGNHARELADAAGQLIVDVLDGLADAIDKYAPQIRDAGLRVAGELIDGMTGGLAGKAAGLLGDIGGGVSGFVGGLLDRTIGDAADSLTLPNQLRQLENAGRTLTETLAKGMKLGANAAVQEAVKIANAIASGLDPRAQALQKEASIANQIAENLQARANAKQKAANQLKKTDPKLAKELQKEADKAQAKADKAIAEAEVKANRVQSRLDFLAADTEGRADIRSDQAEILAARAQKALAEANEKAALAKRLQDTNKKLADKILTEAKKAAREAKKLAQAAKDANAEAQVLYEKSVQERIQDFVNDQVLETGTTEQKLDVLQSIADAEKAKADAAREEAQAYLAKAQDLAATDARQAALYLELAQTKADEAKQAADAAQQALDQANQLRGAGSGTGGAGSAITPSKSILEDAASSVDRYTASLALAEELAGASQTVFQFEQNNYSPESLSAADIYRQSKNLLSNAEIKMTEVSTP